MDQTVKNSRIYRSIELVILISLVLIYGSATYQRNLIWKDDLTLWSDVVKKSPAKARPHNNLGTAYTDEGLFDKAVLEIKKALLISPHPERYIALGNVYVEKGWIDMAMAQYRKALALKPDYAEIHVNRSEEHTSELQSH